MCLYPGNIILYQKRAPQRDLSIGLYFKFIEQSKPNLSSKVIMTIFFQGFFLMLEDPPPTSKPS